MKTKTFFRFFLLGVMTLFTFGAWAQTETPDKDYLCFTAEVAGATVQLNGSPAAVNLEYTTDGSAWTDFVIGTNSGDGVTLANVGDKVYLRNKLEATNVATFSDGDNDEYYRFIIPKNVSVSGNLMSLIDKNVESTTIPCVGCFGFLFYSTSLTSAADLKLPATTLTPACYFQMFNGCSALETAPELPATTLAASCYNAMFYGCKKLKSVKVGFKAWADNVNATYNWLYNAGTEATTPTFVCPDGLAMNKRDDSHVPARWTVTHYLCITAEEAGATVQLTKTGTPAAVNLEYTTDGSAWTDFVIGTTEGCGVTLANVGDKVYLRNKLEAKDVTTFSENNSNYYRFTFSGSVSVSGNIMSLVDKNVETTTIPCDYCFNYLFNNSTKLTSAADLKLPATMLTKGCYQRMFQYCNSLETAPELPATTLATYCYQQMFQGCTKLKSVKVGFTKWGDLSDSGATDYLATDRWLQYAGTKATTPTFVCPAELDMTTRDEKHVPAGWTVTLHAKPDYLCFTAEEANAKVQLRENGSHAAVNLEYTTDGSAWTDFEIGTNSGCGVTLANVGDKVYLRNKLEAKDVTAFSDVDDGYYSFVMPKNVSVSGNLMSLIDKNAESTTIPCDGCFYRLFEECSGLTSVADLKLPATTLKAYCYQNMFIDCENLTTAPATLPAATLAEGCYCYMFNGCYALKTAPALAATTLAASCYQNMFGSCFALETAPALPATTLAASCYQSMFYFCTALKTAPALPAETLAEKCYYEMFSYCENLTTAPATLPAATLATECYYNMFGHCSALETAPALPATTLAERCYFNMFYGCSALKTAPVLPATALAKHCYSGMFFGCESLETAPELPATTLAEYCYNSMFYRCKSLETAPALPAETLVQSCYFQMFYDCKKLNFVKVGFKAWADNENATSNWLKNAGTEATTPTFECPAELDVTTRDEHHVPAGWTVEVTIDDAKPYHAEKDTENATVTYTRTFAAEGQYEALYLPFRVTMTEDLMEKVTIAKIYMVSTKGSVVGGSQDAGVNVVVVKTLEEGESTKPHTPYFIRSEAGTDLEFTQENTTLYAATNAQPGHITCATTMDSYDFIGSYTGEELTPQAGSLIYIMQNGGLKNQTASVTLPCNRWKMVKTPTEWNDSYVAPVPQAKMLIVTLGEDETTGIEGLNLNENENHNKAVYNLQGQRVGSFNGYRGIVIKGGKKFIVK